MDIAGSHHLGKSKTSVGMITTIGAMHLDVFGVFFHLRQRFSIYIDVWCIRRTCAGFGMACDFAVRCIVALQTTGTLLSGYTMAVPILVGQLSCYLLSPSLSFVLRWVMRTCRCLRCLHHPTVTFGLHFFFQTSLDILMPRVMASICKRSFETTRI